jgi:hypothetical protein
MYVPTVRAHAMKTGRLQEIDAVCRESSNLRIAREIVGEKERERERESVCVCVYFCSNRLELVN